MKVASDKEYAVSVYRRMSLIRGVEQICMDFSRGPNPIAAGSIHLCAGQEAIPVGAVDALQPQDKISATYRGHGWAIEAGIPVFEVLSEIAHKATGVNGGRSGSAMIIAPQHRFMGENSIVGAGCPIAAGIALAQKSQETGGISVVSIGDAAMNQGSVHEALVFAKAYNLPVLFICENNGWGEMTKRESLAPVDREAQRARGYGIQAATIDGSDPIAVRDSVAAARKELIAGNGPIFLEFTTVRLWGHYNNDLEFYRTQSDRDEAASKDPITTFRKRIIAEGWGDEKSLATIDAELAAELEGLRDKVINAPLPDPATAMDHVIGPVSVSTAAADKDKEVVETTYGLAVNKALDVELSNRPELLVYGEDVGVGGGIFGCTRNLQKNFGADRVFDTPIAESAILGSALGASMMGMRPVVEIMWADFMLVALDQIVNQMTNLRYLTQGAYTAPLVVRMQQGVTPGSCAQHSQSLEALLFHIPGLRIGLPSTAQDAYDMLRAAVACDDPTIIIESRVFYQRKEKVRFNDTIQSVGGLRQRRSGQDIALISWSTGMPVIEEAAELLAESGISCSVIDLRWLSPLPMDELIEAVNQSGSRAMIFHEANMTGGVGAEIMCRLKEAGIEDVTRLATPDVRIPASPVLQKQLMPNAASVVASVQAQLSESLEVADAIAN